MNNIYKKALEIGKEYLDEGKPITYNELKKELNTPISLQTGETPFANWFILNFNIFEGGDTKAIHHIKTKSLYSKLQTLKDAFEGNNFGISGDALMKLLEFHELEDARKSSKTAKKYAITAIGLNILAISVGVFFSIGSSSSEDIKTLEQATKNIGIQTRELKEELILIESSLKDGIEIYKQKKPPVKDKLQKP